MNEESQDRGTGAGGEKPVEAVTAGGGAGDAKVKDERLWAMLTHLSALAALCGIPLLNIVGPLLIWQIKKGDMPSIEPHGKEAVNFQISIAIYIGVLLVLGTLLMVILVGLLFYLAAGVVAIGAVVYTIIAALKANEGVLYEYPFTIRFIK